MLVVDDRHGRGAARDGRRSSGSTTWNVSFNSLMRSPMIVKLTVCVVTPGANVSIPDLLT